MVIQKSYYRPGPNRKFLKKLITDGCRACYKTAGNRFNRNLIRLDKIENYHDFMDSYDPDLEDDTDILYHNDPGEEQQKQWELFDTRNEAS